MPANSGLNAPTLLTRRAWCLVPVVVWSGPEGSAVTLLRCLSVRRLLLFIVSWSVLAMHWSLESLQFWKAMQVTRPKF